MFHFECLCKLYLSLLCSIPSHQVPRRFNRVDRTAAAGYVAFVHQIIQNVLGTHQQLLGGVNIKPTKCKKGKGAL